MELILHNNPKSMFSEKIRRILAYKQLDWVDVEVPALPPKLPLVPLTGGYRRMPVLQIGADFYCDSAVIARKLEKIRPDPSVFPKERAGLDELVADWADHRFAMQAIIAVFRDILPHVSPEFIADRTMLVADFAPDRVKLLAPHAFDQVDLFAEWVNTALAQTPFLGGAGFSVADASCYHVLNFTRASPRVYAQVSRHPRVVEWLNRIANFSSPNIRQRESHYSVEVAAANTPANLPFGVDLSSGLHAGQSISVAADDYATDPIYGELVALDGQCVVLRRTAESAGEVQVHFPRVGFRITAEGRPAQ